MLADTFPKVLFITPHGFNNVTGSGITFSNLFSGWPKARIATIHNDPEPTTRDVCELYYKLGLDELAYTQPFSWISEKGKAAAVASELTVDKERNSPAISKKQDIWVRGLGSLVKMAKRLFIDVIGDSFPERVNITSSLEEWITDFQPDIIYTILGSNGMMKLVEDTADRFKLPIVVHFMDDWMDASHRKGALAPLLRRQMLDRVNRIVGRATCCLAISPAMKEAYEKRFNRRFEAYQNTIDFQYWSRCANEGISRGAVADIVYIGSIFPNAQLDTLILCCHAVKEINRLGVPAQLTISSPSGHGKRYKAELQVDPSIKIVETIRDDDTFYRRIAAADILLLPVNFDTDSIRFIKYSMPTKVPAYLTAGGPILVCGPAEVAQVAYALSDKWGYVVNEKNQKMLVNAMVHLLEDNELRENLIRNARDVAQKNHDLKVVQKSFQGQIIEACRTSLENRTKYE